MKSITYRVEESVGNITNIVEIKVDEPEPDFKFEWLRSEVYRLLNKEV